MHFPSIIEAEPRGCALDLACGGGRHSIWLAERGWRVTAVDQAPGAMPESITVRIADLEKHEFAIEPNVWDLIVCWLYWQPDLLPEIATGVRPGGIVALAGKVTGRFATSVEKYRGAFPGWADLSSGQNEDLAWFIARKPLF